MALGAGGAQAAEGGASVRPASQPATPQTTQTTPNPKLTFQNIKRLCNHSPRATTAPHSLPRSSCGSHQKQDAPRSGLPGGRNSGIRTAIQCRPVLMELTLRSHAPVVCAYVQGQQRVQSSCRSMLPQPRAHRRSRRPAAAARQAAPAQWQARHAPRARSVATHPGRLHLYRHARRHEAPAHALRLLCD